MLITPIVLYVTNLLFVSSAILNIAINVHLIVNIAIVIIALNILA
jgi:hypothetical protein